MNYFNLQKLMFKVGLGEQPATKRIPQSRNGWGTEAEELENRALLSASGRGAAHTVDAQVVGVDRRAPVVFPAISGAWTFSASGQLSGNGTVNISQNGNKVTSIITIDGLGEFEGKGTFKRRTPNEITFKTPRLELPGAPIKLRLTINVVFPEGDLNPTTFTGTVRVPFVGTVATLNGEKST